MQNEKSTEKFLLYFFYKCCSFEEAKYFQGATMRTEKTVYLIRHGRTKSNVTQVIQGPDEPLDALGHLQAERLASRIAHARDAYPITVILSSSYKRASQTAEIISLQLPGVAVVDSALFAECRHPSRIRGLALEHPEVVRTLKEWRANFHNEHYCYEDGETFAERKERALAALSTLAEYPHDCFALVTHGVFSSYLLNCAMHGEELTSHIIDRSPMYFPNTGILKITYGKHETFSGTRIGWSLHPGDISHLD